MFLRVIILILFILVGGAAASWLALQPGVIRVQWLGWELETRTSLAVAALVIAGLVLLLFDRLVVGIFNMPGLFGRWLSRRRAKSGHQALALGLMAVSAGEPAEAKRQAARAQRLLSAPWLTDLLSAQASHLSGDRNAAGRYFKSLTKDGDTAFLGHIGLARLALEDERADVALKEARKALNLKPKSALAARQVMVLEAERENWSAALPALGVVSAADKSGRDADLIARQKAALGYLDALEHLEVEDGGDRERKRAVVGLQGALKAWPEFWPAALKLAELHVQAGSARKARQVLEQSFKDMPHGEVAAQIDELLKLNEGKFVAALIKLIPASGEMCDEARCVVAGAAHSHGLTGEAKRLVEAIDERHRDVDAWRLVARLAADGEDPAAERQALDAAGDAPRARRWQCSNCQTVHEDWQPHCGNCAAFATIDWRRPDGVTPLPPPKSDAAD